MPGGNRAVGKNREWREQREPGLEINVTILHSMLREGHSGNIRAQA